MDLFLMVKKIIKKSAGYMFKLTHQMRKNHSITVFVYHDITNNPSSFSKLYNLHVPPHLFEYHIQFIKNNFNIISPDDLLNKKIPERAALITFDDGFKSYVENAIPILENYQIPSIIFLNMAPVKGEIFWSGLITYLCDNDDNFIEYLKKYLKLINPIMPLYLNCSTDIVNSYLKKTRKNYKKTIKKYVGEFLTEKDLKQADKNPLVYYGNHLYNHFVPRLLNDKELIKQYSINKKLLSKYSRYRDMFAFTFGAPDTCYNASQIELLLNNGAHTVFDSYPLLNNNLPENFYHRVCLEVQDDTPSKIWYKLYNFEFRKKFYLMK